MQRRIFAAVLCLVLPIAASAAQRRARPRAAAAPPVDLSAPFAQLLPADTFLYLEVNNLAAAAEEVGGVETLYALMERGFGDSGGTLPFSIDDFRKALGSSMAVGIRFPKGGLTTASVDPDVVVLVRTGSADVATLLSKALESSRKSDAARARPRSRLVRGVRVTTTNAATAKRALSTATVGTTLLFGTPSAVTTVLTSAGVAGARTLADVPGFGSASARATDGRQIFAYLNGEPLVRAFNEGVDASFASKPPAEREQNLAAAAALKSFIGLDAVLGGSVSALVGNGGVTVQGAFELDRTRGGLVSVMSDAPPIAFRSAALLPADTDFVLANSVDAVAIYDLVLRVLTPPVAKTLGVPPPPTLIAQAEAQIGMKLRDDLLAAFGNEVAIGLRVEPAETTPTMTTDGQQPKTESYDGVLMFEVRRPETIDSVFTKLSALEGGESGATRETYKDTQLVKLGSMSYAYFEGFGVIGDTAEVKRVVDGVRANETLATSADYAAAVGSVPDNVLTGAYLSPQFFEYASKEVAKTTGVPRQGEAVRSGLFVAVQKDATGVYANVQVPLPNLRLLLEEKRRKEATAAR